MWAQAFEFWPWLVPRLGEKNAHNCSQKFLLKQLKYLKMTFNQQMFVAVGKKTVLMLPREQTRWRLAHSPSTNRSLLKQTEVMKTLSINRHMFKKKVFFQFVRISTLQLKCQRQKTEQNKNRWNLFWRTFDWGPAMGEINRGGAPWSRSKSGSGFGQILDLEILSRSRSKDHIK